MWMLTPERALYGVWIVWAISWLLAAVWSSRPAGRINPGLEFSYRILTSAGFVLLFLVGPSGARRVGGRTFRTVGRFFPAEWTQPQWTLVEPVAWAMVGLAVAGFLFAWWARIHLGALWSGSITRKADHRIVDTGPYGIVRHPIYTGLIAASVAMVLIKATWVALLGLAVMTVGYWLKARFEEGFLRQELGPEAYDAYRKRTPMIVPFSPVRWL